jgi:hypothetical protein
VGDVAHRLGRGRVSERIMLSHNSRRPTDDQLTESVNSKSYLFGAAAIGRSVKFYIEHVTVWYVVRAWPGV